jgi:hypothetical protein
MRSPITCTVPSIIRIIKSRRKRWPGCVARMGDNGRMHRKFWLECKKEIDHQEDLNVSGRIILKWILG